MSTTLTSTSSAATGFAPAASGASTLCFHCGQPVTEPGRWFTRIEDTDQPMCCAGCQAVAQAIIDAGLDDYYRHRSAPGAGVPAVPPQLQALGLFDEADVQAAFVRPSGAGGDAREATLLIEGLRCGACAWLIERSLATLPGLEACTVNFATERAVVRWDPRTLKLSALLARIGNVGYQARPFDPAQREAGLLRTGRQAFRRLFVAGLGMMQVMMYAVPAYLAEAGDIEPEYASLMRWASLVLTAPVVFYSASPFFAGAWRDLKARAPGMDVPVAIGIAAAFAASVWSTASGTGEVYFDSVTMFVFLLLGARYLEWMARRRASRALDAIASGAPEAATRVVAGSAPPGTMTETTETVPVSRLVTGDLVRVAVGERIPVDATIVDGRSAIDQSLLTGESTPVARGTGDEVPGGAINAGNPLLLRVLRPGAQSTLSVIERLIERAAADKPRIAQLADRVAGWFTAALLVFAALVLLAWWLVDPSRAMPIAIAVLVVSCPCALSLATPAALAASTGAVTRRGVLVTRGHALEALAHCTDVVFDKTGTLTEGRPRLVAIEARPGAPDEATLLSIAAALETGSTHPFAQALRAAALAHGTDAGSASPQDIEAVPGSGIEAGIAGKRYRLGSADWIAQWHRLDGSDDDRSEVWLADRERALARFVLEDTPRDDAATAVARLARAGMRVHLLSGDRDGPVQRTADRLGITQRRAQASPADKLAYLHALQSEGRRVLVVGDGINDAPVLAAADVSIAVGEATTLARAAADVVMLSPRVETIAALLDQARRTRQVIVQNLGWAALYNAVAIPAAAFGFVPPWLAALGMSASSLLVAGNALRLLRARTPPHGAPAHG